MVNAMQRTSGSGTARLPATAPARSPEAAAVLNLQQAAVAVSNVMRTALKAHHVSHAQYTVLRILREAGPAGLARHEIAERMIWRAPDVTRILDRLERRSLIARARPAHDQRIVLARISDQGRRLVEAADAVEQEAARQVMSRLGARRLRVFVNLLEELQKET